MKYIFLLFLGCFIGGCAVSESIDNTVDEILVKPTERANKQVDSAQQARDQLEGLQRQRDLDLENIMNQ